MASIANDTFERRAVDRREAGLAEALARFAGHIVETPAAAAETLGGGPSGGEAWAERVARGVEDGWNLVALTTAGAPLVQLLEAAGARVEVLPDAEFDRRHPNANAAYGRAMGSVTAPGGEVLQLSCRLVLRLPRRVAEDARKVALELAWHAAIHAVERSRLPGDGDVAAAIEAVRAAVAAPTDKRIEPPRSTP